MRVRIPLLGGVQMLLLAAMLCVSGHGETLKNGGFSAAVALRITLTERVHILSHGNEFSVQTPEGRNNVFTFSEGLVPKWGTFEVVWDSRSATIRKIEWLSAAHVLAEKDADEILSMLPGSPEIALKLDREMLETCIGVLQGDLGLPGVSCRVYGCEIPLEDIAGLPQTIACLDVSEEHVPYLNALARGYFVLATGYLQGDPANQAFAVGKAFGFKSLQASEGCSSATESCVLSAASEADNAAALFWAYCNWACMAHFSQLSTSPRTDVTQAAALLGRLTEIDPAYLTYMPPCAGTTAEGAVGTIVTIHGEGLGAEQGAGHVRIGGLQASVASWSDTLVEAVVPVIATPHGQGVETTLEISLGSGKTYEFPFTVIRGIVFGSTRDDPINGPQNLFVVNPDGTGLRRLTYSVEYAQFPELSPDGTMIAFHMYSYTHGEGSLWLMDADGSNPRRILPQGTPAVCLTWAPDNETIAFTQPDGFLYSTNLDGSDIRLLMETTEYLRFPSWSPDGKKIAVERTYPARWSEIVILDLEAGEQRVLVEGMHPEWSPDGTRIVYDYPSDCGWSVFTMDADGSNNTSLTCGAMDMYPTWSPDGTRIVFDSCFSVCGLHIMDSTGGNLRSLSFELAAVMGREYCPCWGGVARGSDDATPAATDYDNEFAIDCAETLLSSTLYVEDATSVGASDGSVGLSVSGGMPPYTFSWTGPGCFEASTRDIVDLIAGTYEATVTDANGCSDSWTATVRELTLCTCDSADVCYRDVVVTNAGTDYVNGTYTFTGVQGDGMPMFESEDGLCRILFSGNHWFIVSSNGFEYERLDCTEPTPPSAWMLSEIGRSPEPSSVGGETCAAEDSDQAVPEQISIDHDDESTPAELLAEGAIVNAVVVVPMYEGTLTVEVTITRDLATETDTYEYIATASSACGFSEFAISRNGLQEKSLSGWDHRAQEEGFWAWYGTSEASRAGNPVTCTLVMDAPTCPTVRHGYTWTSDWVCRELADDDRQVFFHLLMPGV